jgi:methionyl-tRNA formyltransferase
MTLKIIFMGTPNFAVPTLEKILKNNFNVIAVYTQPPSPSNRGLKIEKSPVHLVAEQHNLKVYSPKSLKTEEEFKIFKELKADIAVVVAYGQIIPENYLNLSKYGFINIHASLLPKWRGAAPIQRAIMNNDQDTGVSIMKIEKGLDTGPVLLQSKIKIDNEINTGQLTEKLSTLGAEQLLKALDLIKNEKAVFTKQNDSIATLAKKITKLDEEIDWKKDANEIVRKINGLSPKPGANFNLNNEKIKILKAKEVKIQGKAGMTLDDNLLIGCKNNAIQVEEIQRPGKKVQQVKEFLLGFKIQKNTKLF